LTWKPLINNTNVNVCWRWDDGDQEWWKRDVGFVLLSFFMKVDEGRW